jgi:alpha-tubulin suppressor-like RCC1 family protein
MFVLDVTFGFTTGHILAENDGFNRVFGFGKSDKGQVGYGGTLTKYMPVDITAFIPGDVIQISSGAYHTVALTEDNRLFGWGKASRGQLGYKYKKGENTNHMKKPTEIELEDPERYIRNVICGSLYTLA